MIIMMKGRIVMISNVVTMLVSQYVVVQTHAVSGKVSIFLGDVLLAGGDSTAGPDLLRDSSVNLQYRYSVMKACCKSLQD